MAISNEDKAFLEKLTEETAFRITSGMKENIDSLKSILSVSPTPTGEKPKTDDQRKPKGDNEKTAATHGTFGQLLKGITKLVIAQKAAAKATEQMGAILNRQRDLSSRLIQVGNEGLIRNKGFVTEAAKRNIDLRNHTSMILGGYDAGMKGWGEHANDLMTRLANLGLSTTLASRHMVFLTQALGLSNEKAAQVISSQVDLANSNNLMGDHLVKAMVELTDAFTSTTTVFGENMTKGVMKFAEEAHAAVGPGLKDAMNSAITKFTDTSVQNLRRTIPAGITDQALIADPKGALTAAFQKIIRDADSEHGSRIGMGRVKEYYQVTDAEILAMRTFLRNPPVERVAGDPADEARAVREMSFTKMMETVFAMAAATQIVPMQDFFEAIATGQSAWLTTMGLPEEMEKGGLETAVIGDWADIQAEALGGLNSAIALTIQAGKILMLFSPMFRKGRKAWLSMQAMGVGGKTAVGVGVLGMGGVAALMAMSKDAGFDPDSFGKEQLEAMAGGSGSEIPPITDNTADMSQAEAQSKAAAAAEKQAGISSFNRDVLQTIAVNTGSTAESNIQIQTSTGGIHSEIITLKDLLPITSNPGSPGVAPEPTF